MKTGIFGGTFDPPHIGHINVFKAFIEAFNFDKVFVMPVFVPPHKSRKSDTSVEDRLNMTKLAFEELSPKVVVSDLEIKREGKSYTADTIRYFKEKGYEDIYFLCGTDMFLTLDSWYNPSYIFENATIVYARRESDRENTVEIREKTKQYIENFNAKIVPLSAEVKEISSTEIRSSVACGSYEFLTEGVVEYIKEKGLYGSR